MKLYKYALSIAVAASATAMVSCDDDFDRPPVIVPEATIEVNTAISELTETFWSEISDNKFTTIPVNQAGDSIVIGGTVISSDEDGNVFKGLYIRDDSGVAYLRVNAYDLYESYHVGQEVRINVTGLLIGGYGQASQIGTLYNNALGQIAEDEFKIRAQVNGLPVNGSADPVSVTIPELEGYKSTPADLRKWQFQLVKIDGLTFEGGGSQKWCDKPGENGSTSRKLKDANGKTIIAYTNNKCTFASDILPKGTGSVTAILGYFKGTWQLIVMNPATDCEGFEFVTTPDTPAPGPDVPGDAIFSETFKSGIGNFTIKDETLPAGMSAVWKHDSKYGYMIATAYNSSDKSNNASDSWLISPAIDLTGKTAAYLSYDQALNFFSSLEVAKTQAAVNVREVGTTEWKTLTVPSWPSAMSWDFVNSGSIDISAYAGKKIEIGFHYTSTAEKAGTWEVKNVSVTPTATSTPDVPTPPAGSGFSESFATGIGSFTIENVVMNEPLSYVWNHDSKYACMKASAFVNNASQPSDSWLISPVIDLSGMTAPVLAFEQAINKFESVDSAKEQISVCIRLEGATEWTKLPLAEYGSNSSWTFFKSGDISLSSYAGKKVQIAFHYTSTASSSGTWEVKNVTVK